MCNRISFTNIRILQAVKDKRIKTLNYAPGPMDTDMQKEIREEMKGPLLGLFLQFHQEGKLVIPSVSAKKLTKLLANDTYESGSHMDYYDIAE